MHAPSPHLWPVACDLFWVLSNQKRNFGLLLRQGCATKYVVFKIQVILMTASMVRNLCYSQSLISLPRRQAKFGHLLPVHTCKYVDLEAHSHEQIIQSVMSLCRYRHPDRLLIPDVVSGVQRHISYKT